jgi:EAL domain-containing protein (putative c-di-GMP-specific phosphodiesterase class I)/CheY-like chemotaxis protein
MEVRLVTSAPHASDAGLPSRPAGKPSILVVDDDVLLARALGRILQSAGYEVTVANDGSVAVQEITRRPFDVVLSDISMPDMTGVDLLRIVRTYDLDVPLILMSGTPTVETAMEAISLGALQYLLKPFANDVLLEAVERAARLHRMARMKRDAMRLFGKTGVQPGDRAGLNTCFDRALESMWMAFQPIVDATTRTIFGYEALMRTREPSLPDPGAVLVAAERLHQLEDVGRRVRALSAKAFERIDGDALLFVNLHTRDLLDPELYDPDAPLSKIATRVVLEITERSTIDDIKDVQERTSALRRAGFRIAIDDLGVGYAGLSTFAALEPEMVKLDVSLIHNVHMSTIRQRLIGAMTSLCGEMGIRVVAEGIELAEECSSVRGLGCNLLQGHFFAKPGPAFPAVEAFS